jgi:hypothetical protein
MHSLDLGCLYDFRARVLQAVDAPAMFCPRDVLGNNRERRQNPLIGWNEQA